MTDLPKQKQSQPVRLLRYKELISRTGRSKGWIYSAIERGIFPKPVRLGPGPRDGVGWIEAEIDQWVADRIAERDAERKPAPVQQAARG